MTEAVKESEELTEEQMRECVIRLAFDGDERRYEEFCDVVRAGIPRGTCVVLRGSAVTGKRWKDGTPFDGDGPGTSDLDLTLVGDEVLSYYILDGFYLPGVHTKPLSEKDPDMRRSSPSAREAVALVKPPPSTDCHARTCHAHPRHLLGQPY